MKLIYDDKNQIIGCQKGRKQEIVKRRDCKGKEEIFGMIIVIALWVST